MKTIQFLISGAMLLLTGTLSLNAQTNLVSNGNFEELDANGKPVGWGDGYNDEGTALLSDFNTVDATDFKEGKQSGFFARNPAWNLEMIYPSLNAYHPIKNVPAGKTYKFSFWYKLGEMLNTSFYEPAMSMSLWFENNYIPENEELLSSTSFDAIPGVWFYKEIEGIKSGSSVDNLSLGFIGMNCEFWLDDVQMVDQSDVNAINDVQADAQLPIYVSGGMLYVGATTRGEVVSVYSITGQILRSENAESTTTVISGLSTGQMYLVKCGARSAKVIL